MPNDFCVDYLEAFLDGVRESCSKWDVNVVGGDTKWGSVICFTATCIGKTKSGNVLRRSGANSGDCLFVSGQFGLFSTALTYFLFAKPNGFLLPEYEEEYLKSGLVLPEAKVDVGIMLSDSGY